MFLFHAVFQVRHLNISQSFTTTLLRVQFFFFSVASILVSSLLPPFKNNLYSNPVFVTVLHLQLLVCSVLQCLMSHIMMSLQATFQSTKEVKSDGVRSGLFLLGATALFINIFWWPPWCTSTWPSIWDSLLSENIWEDGDDKEDAPISVTDYSLLY